MAAPKITALSQEIYDNKVKSAISIQPIRKTVPLGDLSIVNPGLVNIKGKPVAMSKKAFSQLAKILGVPIQFQGRVDKLFGEEANRQLVNRMKSALIAQGVSTITIVANPREKEIIGFLKRENQYISHGSFFGMLEDLIGDNSLSVRDFSVRSDGGGVIINCYDPTAEFALKGLKDEVFRGGVTFSNSIEGGIIVSPYVDRLVCANGMIGEAFSEKYKLRNLGQTSLEEFRNHLQSLQKQQFRPMVFEERVNKAMSTRASLAEIEAAADLILRHTGYKEEEISSWVPIKQTKEEFIRAGILPMGLSEGQKKNAKTSTPLWDVINGLTHFSTHDNGLKITDYERRSIQKEAGALLADTFDMENLIETPF